ncbi:MAG: hypothetical protein JWQ11_3490 [Rhizobacter sp.]|nr:hypothetical protein [Rhizobacter sp.]
MKMPDEEFSRLMMKLAASHVVNEWLVGVVDGYVSCEGTAERSRRLRSLHRKLAVAIREAEQEMASHMGGSTERSDKERLHEALVEAEKLTRAQLGAVDGELA